MVGANKLASVQREYDQKYSDNKCLGSLGKQRPQYSYWKIQVLVFH